MALDNRSSSNDSPYSHAAIAETEPKPKRAKGQLNVDLLFDAPSISEEQSAKINVLRTGYKALAQTIVGTTPMCADQRSALRLLRESFNTARDSILLDGSLTGLHKTRNEIRSTVGETLTVLFWFCVTMFYAEDDTGATFVGRC